MATHRHQSSLEGVLDFSIPLSLKPQQHESARNLVIGLVRQYGLEKTVRKGYKPATLIQATLEHVASPDTFLTFFLSYIYEDYCSEKGPSDITHTLLYFDGFSSWEPEQINNVHEALENFAEYIVENFLLPRVLLPRLYDGNYNEHMLIINCSQGLVCQDTTTNAHIVIVVAELNPDRDKTACISFTTELPCTRSPPLCSVPEIRQS